MTRPRPRPAPEGSARQRRASRQVAGWLAVRAGPRTLGEIARDLGRSVGAVDTALSALADRGEATPRGRQAHPLQGERGDRRRSSRHHPQASQPRPSPPLQPQAGCLAGCAEAEQVFPRPCVDERDEPEPDPAVELEKRLGIADLWPPTPDMWDDSTFYGLIEVYHDLVSRPREWLYHDYGMCRWHYSHFSMTVGREVYRWKVNELLQADGIG